jgi:hypothetical protein
MSRRTHRSNIYLPAPGTPAEIISVLNGAIRAMVAIAEVKERFGDLGIEAKASSPEEALGARALRLTSPSGPRGDRARRHREAMSLKAMSLAVWRIHNTRHRKVIRQRGKAQNKRDRE